MPLLGVRKRKMPPKTNHVDQFKLAFDLKAMAAVIARMERNEEIYGQFMSNEELRALALELMMKKVYEHFQTETEPAA